MAKTTIELDEQEVEDIAASLIVAACRTTDDSLATRYGNTAARVMERARARREDDDAAGLGFTVGDWVAAPRSIYERRVEEVIDRGGGWWTISCDRLRDRGERGDGKKIHGELSHRETQGYAWHFTKVPA